MNLSHEEADLVAFLSSKLLPCLITALLLNPIPVLGARRRGQSPQLIKVQTMYYRLPGRPSKQVIRHPRIFTMDPRFHMFKNGKSVLVDGDRELLFFDQWMNLIRIAGGIGRLPGKFPMICVSIVPTPDDNIVAIDVAGRLNVYNSNGALLRSLLMPDFNTVFNAACIDDRSMIVSGAFFSPGAASLAVKVYDLDEYKYVSSLYSEGIGRGSVVSEKRASASARAFFLLTGDDQVFCNVSTRPDIVYFDLKTGARRQNDQLPLNFSPLSGAPKYYIEEALKATSHDEQYKVRSAWYKTWSWSGCPTVYSDSILIVRRRMVAPYYLDFYSVTDCRYIGQCTTEKPFMYADRNWIYLCDDFNDTLLTVGKYKVAFRGIGSPQGRTVHQQKVPKKLLRRYSKAISTAKTPPASFRHILITPPDGKTRRLLTELDQESNHILLFFSPFDCGVLDLMDISLGFVTEYKAFDLYLVITHPDTSDLGSYARGIESMYGLPVVLNTDHLRILEMGIRIQPALGVIDRHGEVLGIYSSVPGAQTPYFFLKGLAEPADKFPATR